MANILYVVNGEGAAHSTRPKEVIAHLSNSGYKNSVLVRNLAQFVGEYA